MKRALLALLTSACLADAQDVLEMKAGAPRTGKIIAIDEKSIRLQLDIPAQDGSAPRAIPSISIPRADVRSIEFASDPAREGAMRSAGPQDIPALEDYWEQFTPWLETPRSPSAAIACALGNALLATKERRNAERALQLFKLVEEKAWQPSDRDRAREGRLRAMSATGRAEKAIEEAKALAAETENPEILIEANHLMAQAAERQLRAFLKENPRWDIDPNVIDVRHKLHARVLELYLYPSLFFGTNNEKAARGLWGAVGIYQLCGDQQLAIETSRDIVAFYPATPDASHAKAYLTSLSPEKLATDWEAEGKKEIHEDTSQKPPSPEASPTPEESPKPAKEKKKKPKNT
jgi:hypothetical protein